MTVTVPTEALATVLKAAAAQATLLQRLADNPFGAGNLPSTASARAVEGWKARRRAEVDEIEAAISELRATT